MNAVSANALDPRQVVGGLPPEQEALWQLLGKMIAELPDPYATVLLLVEIEGAGFAEAAMAMGLSAGSVRLLYAEGRRRLRDVVLAHTEAGGEV